MISFGRMVNQYKAILQYLNTSFAELFKIVVIMRSMLANCYQLMIHLNLN